MSSSFRHSVLIVAFAAVTIALVARTAYLTVVDRDFLQKQAAARSVKSVAVDVHRGTIFDRRGEPLSVSTPVASAWIDPGVDSLTDDEVARIADKLGTPVTVLRNKLDEARNRRFVYLARGMLPERERMVRALGIPTIRWQTEYRRYYPLGEVAAHIVGITDIDNRGREGIELSLDRYLRGSPGSKKILSDLKGRSVRDLKYEAPPISGRDIVLTIDSRLQYLAYQEIKEAVDSRDAKSGSIVLCEVATGDVLALVNYPSYNPNNTSDRRFSSMRNRAVTDVYAPGSTMKPFVMLAALGSGRYTTETVIDTSPGWMQVGNKTIKDPLNYGALSLTQVLAKSSQVGIVKIALDLQPNKAIELIDAAGLFDLPNSGLPGEATGHLNTEDLKRTIGRVTMSYGYGMTATPMQLAQSYVTLATSGIRRSVSVVRSMYRIPEARVLDEGVARTVLDMMGEVVTPYGTARAGRIEGLRVAGKTGTTQKLSGIGYDDSRHIALFAGIAPLHDPKIVMVVVVDEPGGDVVSGGGVAAPIFSRVALRALHLIGIDNSERVQASAEEESTDAA